jgi:hypothetical protein
MRLDVHQAQALKGAGNLTDEVLFHEAVHGLWRGEALVDVPGPFADWERARLREMRISGELYRSIPDGRRVLPVLDDAAGPAQVRPLIPRGSACVIITSRRDETALAALDAALRLALGPLAGHEAVSLLACLIDDDVAADHQPALSEPAEGCGRLSPGLVLVAESVGSGTGPPADRVMALASRLRGRRAQMCARARAPDPRPRRWCGPSRRSPALTRSPAAA